MQFEACLNFAYRSEYGTFYAIIHSLPCLCKAYNIQLQNSKQALKITKKLPYPQNIFTILWRYLSCLAAELCLLLL